MAESGEAPGVAAAPEAVAATPTPQQEGTAAPAAEAPQEASAADAAGPTKTEGGKKGGDAAAPSAPPTSPPVGAPAAAPAARGVRVHVRNLAESTTSDQLRKLFEPFGQVLEAGVKAGEDGKCKGMGFAVLSSEEEAVKATAELNGTTLDEKQISVTVVERKQAKGQATTAKGKGKGTTEQKGKGKGKTGKAGTQVEAKGKGAGKGRGRGQVAAAPPPPAAAVPSAYQQSPYMYGMPPYGYGMYPPYMPPYGMYPGYPFNPVAAAAAAAAYNPAALQAAALAAMGMWAPGARTAGGLPAAAATAAQLGWPVPPTTPPAAPPAEPAPAPAVITAAAAAPAKGAGAPSAKKRTAPGKGKGKEPAGEAPPADKVFEGTLKSISEKNGYGFISNPEARELYDRDVWVDGKALPSNVKAGDRLRFHMALSDKGHPQAQKVTVVA